MKLVPLYIFENRVLIGLEIDHLEETVEDSLVLEIHLKDKIICNPPWSGQKRLKFGFYYPIQKEDRAHYLNKIKSAFDHKTLLDIENMLLNPTQKQIDSLIWIPDRLIKS